MDKNVPVPRDLTRVKSKILFNLTARQLICFGLAAVIGIPLYFMVKKAANPLNWSRCQGQISDSFE